ncbi:thiamine-binding protein [Rothia sp. LK2588]|uniref:MTH1187 family thiamine-binding protein n=1 Tax=Rothia sp. LK2588 TaxID=3114369 RepID=UPI0034CDF686
MLFAFSVAPTGGAFENGSVHSAVAAAVRIVNESGLPHETNSMFTIIEGEWDECMAVVKAATEAVAEVAPRVSLVVKADIRAGHDSGEITGKVERLNKALDDLS